MLVMLYCVETALSGVRSESALLKDAISVKHVCLSVSTPLCSEKADETAFVESLRRVGAYAARICHTYQLLDL